METTTAETAVDSSEYVLCIQRMEGQNLQHLKYGTSGAQQLTASFWVKSSVAAVFGIYMYSGDGVRIIGSTYTINSANTWEYKTVTFVGDTGGTINNDNGAALYLGFVLAAGSGMRTTDNTSWGSYSSGKLAYGHTAAANAVMTTSGATWQLTGVQLEVGDTATPFEHRSYGDELAKCYRYYFRHMRGNVSGSTGSDSYLNVASRASSSNTMQVPYQWPVPMRTKPSLSRSGNVIVANNNTASTGTGLAADSFGLIGGNLQSTGHSSLSANQCVRAYLNASGAWVDFDAEL
jgi:hypothetical protein